MILARFAPRTASACLLVGLLSTGVGCAVSPAVEAARARDITALARALEAEDRAGDLDDSEVRDVAHALLAAEIAAAKGAEGANLVTSLGGCADAMDDELDDRSEQTDVVAAAAAATLVSAGVEDAEDYAHYILEPEPGMLPEFRAVGARGLTDDDDFAFRKKLYRDLDENVRLGAFRAAIVAPDQGDYAELAESARLDPLPIARSAAVRAFGRLGGEAAVMTLRDLWTRADGNMREAIVDAWSQGASFGAGGEGALVFVAEQSAGRGSIAAAVTLSRAGSVKSRDIGQGVLARAIALGTREERVFAITAAPSTPVILEAIRKAQKDEDKGVALAALSRVADEGDEKERASAKNAVFEIAKSKAQEAPRAQYELARLEDRRASPLLVKLAADKNPFARAYAARGFLALEEWSRAGRLLADKDKSVRSQVACAAVSRP